MSRADDEDRLSNGKNMFNYSQVSLVSNGGSLLVFIDGFVGFDVKRKNEGVGCH
jgi:hypothetical protein